MIEGYRPELESTPAAREATRFMLLNPPVPLVVRPGYALIAAGAVALLRLGPPRAPAPVSGPGVVWPRARACRPRCAVGDGGAGADASTLAR